MAYVSGSSGLSTLIRHANKTLPQISKEVQNAVWDDFTFLKVMKAMGGIDQGNTGSRHNWPLEMDRNPSVGARGYQDEIDQEMTDRHRIAEQDWAYYTGAFVIAEDKVDLNSGPEQWINYYMSEVKGLRKSLEEKINSDALKGAGTGNSMTGLSTIIPETNSSGTLHGRDLSTDTWFRNQSTASSCSTTDAFGPIVMKEILDQAAIAGRGQGKNPFRLGITDDATFNNMVYYMPTMGTQAFYTIANQSGPSNFTKDMQISEPLVNLRGARIMWDHAASADAMRFFDPGNTVKWLWGKNNFFRMSGEVPSENTFAYTVKMGCICMLINCNPYTTGVIYNFNS